MYLALLFEVLARCVPKLRIYDPSNIFPTSMDRVVRVDDVAYADAVLLDAYRIDLSIVEKIATEIRNDALLMLVNAVVGIDRCNDVVKQLVDRGFVRTWIPIDGGVATFAKRGYDDRFLQKVVDVWRKSIVEGPYPIHFNTAYALYTLSKFVLSHRKGWVVEIGTGLGFSTLWLAQVAKEFGSRVLSIDRRCDRVEYARSVAKELELDDVLEIVCSDAKTYRYEEVDRIVLTFIDGEKSEYLAYLEAVEGKLVDGATILAHNALSNAYAMKGFLERICSEPYRCIVVATDPAGLAISVRC